MAQVSSKQLKQIIQIEHNFVKNPNWPEANQLAIYKRDRGSELGATEKQIDSNPGPLDCESDTLPTYTTYLLRFTVRLKNKNQLQCSHSVVSFAAVFGDATGCERGRGGGRGGRGERCVTFQKKQLRRRPATLSNHKGHQSKLEVKTCC